MPAKHEEKPFTTRPGRSRPQEIADRPEDKHGRSLMTQHDPQPDWGRGTEEKLKVKRGLRRIG